MTAHTVFISYSHKDKQYRQELESMLGTVPNIAGILWFDEQEIDIGDKFHPEIQQALDKSTIGILLLSKNFFNSSYIKQHELPRLIVKAERGQLKLAPVYLSSIPDGAFKRKGEIDSQQYDIDLRDYIGVNSPAKPLDLLNKKGERERIYTKLADWVAFQTAALEPMPDQEPGRREELAIALSIQAGQLSHSFSLPSLPDFARPRLEVPDLATLTPSQSFSAVGGDELFQLLFGTDAEQSKHIFQAIFNTRNPVKPGFKPLRIRLITSDSRLWALSWNNISADHQPLFRDGWTVELHDDENLYGFPEYPAHTCFFPGKVVLSNSQETADTEHRNDLQHFFQYYWSGEPDPVCVDSKAKLIEELDSGSTRLLYHFGKASAEGLILEENAPADDKIVSWNELAERLQQSRSASLIYLNLLGDADAEVIARARHLLKGARIVLLQYHRDDKAARSAATRSAIDGLYSIFVSPQLDPVVALHRYQPAGSHATAWTCYSGWKTINRPQPGDPDLVNLLLDRHRQRADLLQVKLDLASHATRRIHHTVAFGLAGCRVGEFPRMASLHLRRSGKKDNEVVLYRPLSVTLKLGKQQQIDDAVQRQYQVDARQSVVRALLREQTIDTQNYWFLVLGWIVPDFLETGRDLDKTKALLQAITDWCRQRLSDDLDKLEQSGHIRVLSVVAVESLDEGLLDDLQETIEELSEQHDDSQMFQIGELDRLEGVKRSDLRHYFDDPQVCNCDDRYRQDFPKLLLGERREMPFDEAVRTIRRGHPSNWGNLYQELQDMSNNNEWPPKTYDPDFWQKRNGR